MRTGRAKYQAHILYRMYSASDELLYTGITVNARARWRTHSEEKTWWPDVATIKIQHFADRVSVERAEREAIQSEQPRYNVMHSTRSSPECEALLRELALSTQECLEANTRRKEAVRAAFALEREDRPSTTAMAEAMGMTKQGLYQLRDKR